MSEFVDVTYSYAINGNETRPEAREHFLEYLYDIAPDEADLASQPFATQASGMLSDLDAFDAELRTPSRPNLEPS